MNLDLIKGICPIVAAPFAKDESVDYDSLRHLVATLAKGGCHALTLFGIAGEYYKLDEAEQRGITILPIVYGAPAWAKPAWEHADAYAEFCRATVIHYGKRIPVIELWNEENISPFWNKEDPDASKYVAMCKKAYKAIKEADPSIRVALGGVLCLLPSVPPSMIRLLPKESPYPDGESIHFR